MIDKTTARNFLENLIYKAAQMTGDTSGIMDVIKRIEKEFNIDGAAADIAENNRRLQIKELENEKEKIAAEIAALLAGYGEADHNKRQEILETVNLKNAELNKTVNTTPQIITSKDLMNKTFEPRTWVVENLITTGLTILSGAPKIGKSWLLFALAEAASTGGMFMGHYTVNQAPILHLSLEDTEQSIQERRAILRSKQKDGFSGNADLHIATQWETGIIGLENYLREHRKIKFVIIDTLGRFMPDIEDMSDYAPTVKALSGIKKLADNLSVAILVVHHAKKGGSGDKNKGDWMDQSLGSQGIVGSADTVFVLQRDIDKDTGERKNTGNFYATGRSIRDIFHNVEYIPDFGMWSISKKKKSSSTSGSKKNVHNDKDDPRGGWGV